jgi:outer membrane protein OmpA-like peptidoglycan-associated protein
MRSWCPAISCLCVFSVSSLFSVKSMAQEAAAAAQLSASADLSTATEGESSTADDGAAATDYLHRYPPFANALEIGVFGGLLVVSDNNSFRGPATVSGGMRTPPPYSKFEPAPEFGARVAYFPLSFLGAEIEGMIAPAETTGGEGATIMSGRAHAIVQAPFWSIVPFALGGAGYWWALNSTSGDDSDPGFHFGGGVKVAATSDLAFRLEARDTITNQRAVGDYPNHLEVTAGASMVLGRPKKAPADSDADGLLDPDDRCPQEAGPAPGGCPLLDRDGDQILDDQDQCADQPGLAPTGCPPTDADADGVLDSDDQCVQEAGIFPTGCPDGDADGILNRDDQCPTVAGLAPLGCPGDADKDGFLDSVDKCPAEAESKNGFEDDDGCPDEIPDAVKTFTGVIAGINFDVNKDTIRASSHAMLDQAAAILKEHPTLKVEIVGHTDDTGSREHNLELSLKRAASVKSYLVSQGVDEARIIPRGAGPDEPLANGKTPQARQKNRRIEFQILK